MAGDTVGWLDSLIYTGTYPHGVDGRILDICDPSGRQGVDLDSAGARTFTLPQDEENRDSSPPGTAHRRASDQCDIEKSGGAGAPL